MLVVDYGFFPNVPGVVEQSQCRVVLTHHELRLAEVYAGFVRPRIRLRWGRWTWFWCW